MKIYNFHKFEQSLKALGFSTKNVGEQYHIFRLEDKKDPNEPIHTPATRYCFFDITLFTQVDFNFQYASQSFHVLNNTLQINAPNQVLKVDFEPEDATPKGYTLLFKEEFLSANIDNRQFLKEFPFFSFTSLNNVIRITSEEVRALTNIFESILYEQQYQLLYNQQAIQGYIFALLYQVKRIWKRETQTNKIDAPCRNALIVSNFEKLIREHLDVKFQINDFAEIMNLTPKHLSTIIKSVTGQSPKAFFNNLLIIKAKNLLRHTDLSISEVAYMLGFEDPSYFSKFFKKATRRQPRAFRQQGK